MVGSRWDAHLGDNGKSSRMPTGEHKTAYVLKDSFIIYYFCHLLSALAWQLLLSPFPFISSQSSSTRLLSKSYWSISATEMLQTCKDWGIKFLHLYYTDEARFLQAHRKQVCLWICGGGENTTNCFSSRSTITLLIFYRSRSKSRSTAVRIYWSKSKK